MSKICIYFYLNTVSAYIFINTVMCECSVYILFQVIPLNCKVEDSQVRRLNFLPLEGVWGWLVWKPASYLDLESEFFTCKNVKMQKSQNLKSRFGMNNLTDGGGGAGSIQLNFLSKWTKVKEISYRKWQGIIPHPPTYFLKTHCWKCNVCWKIRILLVRDPNQHHHQQWKGTLNSNTLSTWLIPRTGGRRVVIIPKDTPI